MKKSKEIIVPALLLLIICIVATTLLAVTNSVTKAKIADNSVQKQNSSKVIVLPEAKDFSEDLTAENGVTYCKGSSDGKDVGFVFTSSAKGYGGEVAVMVGMDNDGNITGVEILSHSETPGLGANSTKPDFKNRFIGKSGTLTVDKNSNEGQSVQAITAATITSKAVTSAVNAAGEAFAQISGGAK